MRRRYALLVPLLAVIGACSDDDPGTLLTPESSSTAVTVAPPATEAPLAETATSTSLGGAPTPAPSAGTEVSVGITDFKFEPATVNVPVGGSVVWTNNDDQSHTATSAGNFDAGAIEPQTSMTVTFETAGSFTYICSFHPFMSATVIVG